MGPNGNIGYPFKPEEIDHFMSVITKEGRRIDADAAESAPASPSKRTPSGFRSKSTLADPQRQLQRPHRVDFSW